MPVLRRMFPDPAGDVTIEAAYDQPRRRAGDRPWVGVCMVASLDGAGVVTGGSRAISNPLDAAVLSTLRRLADVVLVGATTVREEGYGPSRTPGQRIGVISGSGAVDPSSELFRSGSGFLVTTEDGPGPPDPSIDVVRAGSGRVDLRLALTRLADVVDAPSFVHVEGGPRLNGALVAAECVDELNLTLSPSIVGGDGSRIVAGAGEQLRNFQLAHLLADEQSFVYGRWLRRRPDD